MLKIKNRAIATSLIGILSLGMIGCGNKDKEDSTKEATQESIPELSYCFPENNKESEKIEQDASSSEETVEEEMVKISSYDTVTATGNVNIRESAVDGKVLGILHVGESLPMVEKLTNGWYAVEYNNNVAYISGKYLKETIGFEIEGESIGIYYTDKETDMITPDYLNNGEAITSKIAKTTCINVYEENDDYYLCSVDNKVGYILKSDVVKLSGNYAIVDISDQTLRLYEDETLVLETPVVTGKPSTPTDLGLFQIYDITHNRYLVGPGYASYVDIMMKYNGGEGLHDAEYHVDDDGFEHGWREIDEFGGTTYLTNGSHGCVNMPHEAAMEAGKVLKLGDHVLVQE